MIPRVTHTYIYIYPLCIGCIVVVAVVVAVVLVMVVVLGPGRTHLWAMWGGLEPNLGLCWAI